MSNIKTATNNIIKIGKLLEKSNSLIKKAQQPVTLTDVAPDADDTMFKDLSTGVKSLDGIITSIQTNITKFKQSLKQLENVQKLHSFVTSFKTSLKTYLANFNKAFEILSSKGEEEIKKLKGPNSQSFLRKRLNQVLEVLKIERGFIITLYDNLSRLEGDLDLARGVKKYNPLSDIEKQRSDAKKERMLPYQKTDILPQNQKTDILPQNMDTVTLR